MSSKQQKGNKVLTFLQPAGFYEKLSKSGYCILFLVSRYWECVGGQPELYDCPNGLVFAGKHRGVTEGCDYPWRANYCDGKQLASK